jgi:hypothetical protein
VANADPMVAAAREGGDHRVLVGSLAVTQTVGYGVLSYAFAVFLTPMARDLHASPTAITAALTLAVLVSAVATVSVAPDGAHRYPDGASGPAGRCRPPPARWPGRARQDTTLGRSRSVSSRDSPSGPTSPSTCSAASREARSPAR